MVPRNNFLERWVRRLCHVLALLQQVSTVQAQDPPYRSFTVADGLPSNTVYWVLEDHDGYLWFGTDVGASRFDGHHFQNFTTNDGLADNEVLAMFEDSRHRIWFHSLNGRICYWQNGGFHGEEEHPEFKRMPMVSGLHSVVEAPDGSIWLAGLVGSIFRWKDGHAEAVPFRTHCAREAVTPMVRLLAGNEGTPWLVSLTSLWRITASGLEFVRCWDIPLEHTDRCGTRGNGLAFVAGNTINRADAQGSTLIATLGTELTSGIAREPRSSRNGDFWIPFRAGGLLWIERAGLHDQRVHTILGHMNVLASFDDRDDGRWVTTDGHGVIRIDQWQRQLGVVRVSHDLRERSVTCVLATREHGVLFGTAQGNIGQWKNGKWRSVMTPEPSGAVRNRVRTLAEDTEGRIWFASDKQCGWLEPREGAPWPLRRVASMDPRIEPMAPIYGGMKSIVTGPRGEVVGCFFGCAFLEDVKGAEVLVIRKDITPVQQRIYTPFVDSSGTVWFENSALLHSWQHGRLRTFKELEPHCGARITDIDGLQGGRLVIATAGNGVLLVDSLGQRSFGFTRANGLPSDQCRSVVVRNGEILVATDNGGALISSANGHWQVVAWTTLQGLPTGDVQGIDRKGDSLFLATPEGLCIVPVRAQMPQARVPELRIGSFEVNGGGLSLRDTVVIEQGDRASIGLRAISFGHPDLLAYAFSHGTDTSWHPLPSSILPLEGLMAGEHHYRFRVRGPGREWSATIAQHIVVRPPWYWNGTSKMLLFLGGLLFVAGIVTWSMRRAVRNERAKRERQQALTEERQRIASDMHDDLGADISHLLMLARHTAGSASLAVPDKHNVETMESYVTAMLKKVDEVIWSLDPADDKLRAVLEFLQRYTETFAAENGMGFRTQPIGPFTDQRMAGQQRRELYLLLKELLHNVCKHTDACNLRYIAHVTDNAIAIQLEDDGAPVREKGLPRNGHGMNNIRHRARNLRADLVTEPLRPAGTRVLITLPRRWIDQF